MKKLPLGIQTIRKMREGGYLYIDKTEAIHRLISQGGQYFFLSRPRRFGKSLLVSTLKEIFLGHKELFQGLWIYDLEQKTVTKVLSSSSGPSSWYGTDIGQIALGKS